jgi:hypothetical protein
MADSGVFLSTIAEASATMVAIIGGLLVARFVTLISERAGAESLADNASVRLEVACRRAREARDTLYTWQVRRFFQPKIITTICNGTCRVNALRELGDYTALTDDEISHEVEAISAEFQKAKLVIGGYKHGATGLNHATWDEFKSSHSELPATQLDSVWEVAFYELITRTTPRPNSTTYVAPLPILHPLPRSPEFVVNELRHRDDLLADVARTQQHAEDIEAERETLQRSVVAIARPKGLRSGMVILTMFTISGVVVPIWFLLMSPKQLTAGRDEIAFWLFVVGLALLLVYIGHQAVRLYGLRDQKMLTSLSAKSS